MSRFAFLFVTWLIVASCDSATVGQSTPAQLPKLTPAQQDKLKERDRLMERAHTLVSGGKLAEARATVQKCLVIEQMVFGDAHRVVAETLMLLRELSVELGDFPAAQDYAKKTLAICKQLHGEAHWETTNAQLDLADIELSAKLTKKQRDELDHASQLMQDLEQLNKRGEYEQALKNVEKALGIRVAILGVNHRLVAEAQVWLGSLHRSNVDYAKATRAYQQALAISKDVCGEKHPGCVISLINLAALYQEQSFFSKSEPLYLEALAIIKNSYGVKHPDYATSLNNLGALYEAQGLFTNAEVMYKRAIDIRRAVLGESHPDYALTLNNLAHVHVLQGLPSKAEPLYIEALAIQKKVHGEKHPDYALTLNNLAGLYDAQGLFLKAEPLYIKALAINQEVLGVKHPNYALSLNNLAALYASQGLYAKAESLYTHAMAICKKTLGDKHPNYALSLNNLAALYRSQHLFTKAEPLFQEALAIRKKVLGEKHPEYATSLHNLATLYQEQGLFTKAEPMLKEALAINSELLGPKHPDYARTLNNLAALYQSQRLFTKAEPLCQEAVRIIEDHLEETAAIQGESAQLSFTAAKRFYLNNLLRLRDTSPSAVYPVVFRWRGVVTARQTFARATRGTDLASRQTLAELREVTRRLSNLVNNPPKPGPEVNVPKLLNDLNEQRETLEKKLASQSKGFAQYRESRRLTVADIQKLLPADAVLIDFLVYDEKIAAFIITPKSLTRDDLVTSTSQIAEMVRDFRSETSLKRTRPVQGDEDKSVLREAVWEPLVPHLKGVNMVLICPDGPLCQLPFAALRGNDPKKYLIEEVGVAVIPVPKLLPELLAERPKGQASLLVVGDVDFSGDPGVGKLPGELAVSSPTRAGGPLSWKPLDATAGEIQKIEDMFRKNAPGEIVKSLTKGDATEAAIRREAGKHRYLHFATHGFFDDPKPTVKTDPKTECFSENRTRPTGPNPGLLCGLVCAGANKPTPDDDGVLTALEIADLDLGGVELAVLSACETGLGEVAGGDGVLGLQRAFQLAGARTTVTSLWQVPDEATSALMVRFYETRLSKGTPALKALRESQLWVLNEGVKAGVLKEEPKNGRRTPPMFWAAFVLAGDWR